MKKATLSSGLKLGGECRSRTGDLPECFRDALAILRMNEKSHPFEWLKLGGECRSRTGDLLHAMQAL